MSSGPTPESGFISESAPDPTEPWQRVHPASPLVRGWLAVIAVAFVYGQNMLSSLVEGEDPYPAPEVVSQTPLLVPLLIGAGILLLVLLGFFGTWWFTKYQITDRHVNVNSGMIFRQQRQARIDRVQSIDIAQPLVARILGLAELRFDVADSGSSAMHLSFVKLSVARDLRTTILARAAGRPSVPAVQESESGSAARPVAEPNPEAGVATAPAAGTEERVVLRVPVARLIISMVLRPVSITLVLGIIAAAVLMSLIDGFTPFYLLPAFLGMGTALWNNLNTGYNFTAATSAEGLRLSYGLLDTRHQSVPPGRVAAIKISAPLLWRKLGWYKMSVNVAGIGGDDANDGGSRSVLLPVGTFEDVLAVLSVVLPDPGTTNPREFFAAAVNGAGTEFGFITSPARVRPLAPLAHARQGYALTTTALVARNGALHRTLAIVPHARTQGLSLKQGPLARRFEVADLYLSTIAGPVTPMVRQLDIGHGRELFLEQADRAAAARKTSDSNHWLEKGV
ncbi:PH domain-containing protein [Paeniglutamicibacter terrestris]|uniref:PH domain-containing protein n=1 Tax=Paeniglutamicibacter terrestris TaxID=2723403 RepID=A0ABX1G901_9MICC|nr:PH domain-containing protein [Paeniglutamicibacter terrestris]NKG22739.1 PH domain-containing protein [Paeniglutamicibacter terrestris]